MTWKESGLQIITALIGSSILVTGFTAFISNTYFQPNIVLSVLPNSNPILSVPSIDYYEIVIRNTGPSSATNVKFSAFFFGNITKSSAIIHSENVILDPQYALM